MTKPTMWLCAQRRLRSAWASAQSDQSLRCPHEENLGPQLPIKRTAKTLIRLGAQSLCWFCHVAAHLLNELFCIVQIIGQLQQYFGFLRKLTFSFAAQNVYSNTEAAKKYLLGTSPGPLSHLVPFFDYLSRKTVRDLPTIMENGMELCSTNILKCFLLDVSSQTEVTNN